MAAQAAVEAPPPPSDPLAAYYRNVRQMNLQLARDRYKSFYKFRTQEFIRGRGTVAVVDEDVCMGCTHCFDNCAFEAIDMADRKFSLPEYTYTSRKAVILYDNCVGCEKCALVCPVDAINMIPKHGWEFREGKLVQTAPPPPKPALKPAAAPAAPAPKPPAPAPQPTAPIAPKPAAAPPAALPKPAPPAPKPTPAEIPRPAVTAPPEPSAPSPVPVSAAQVLQEIKEAVTAQAKRAEAIKREEAAAPKPPPKPAKSDASEGKEGA